MFPISKSADKLTSRTDLDQLRSRSRGDLPFVAHPATTGGPLMLDAGVYIHGLRGQTSPTLRALLRVRIVHHSVVAAQEILHAIGVLDPAHPDTAKNVAAIRALLDAIPLHRLYTPDRNVSIDAAVYAGILCRLRGYAKDRRVRALHDCTLFCHALKAGCTLLTANVADFDVIHQMQPAGRVLFYEAA